MLFKKKIRKKDGIETKGSLISKFSNKLGFGLLNVKICFLFVTLLIVLLLAGRKTIIDYRRKSLEEEFQKKGKIFAKIFVPWCVKALEEQDDIFLLNILNSLRQQENVMYNVILDGRGKVIGHTNVYKLGKEYTDDITRKALASDKLLIQSYQKGEQSLYDYGIPLITLGEKIGVLRFGLSKKKVEKELKKFISKINFFIGVIIVLLGAEVFLLVNYKISKPLYKIKEAIGLLGGQYFEYKVNIKTKDVISEISVGIENFIKQIKNEFELQEERRKECSLVEMGRLGEILNAVLKNSNKKVMVADVNNNIVFSNIIQKECGFGLERDKIMGCHLLDVIKEEKFIALLNKAFTNKGEIVKEIINFSGEKEVSILMLAEEEERGPKTVVVFENVI